MIEVKSVTKKYGGFTAIENINLTVDDCSVLGIAGFNGSGKTTLLNVCAGVFKADKGAVYLDGKDVFDNDEEKLSLFYGFYRLITINRYSYRSFFSRSCEGCSSGTRRVLP